MDIIQEKFEKPIYNVIDMQKAVQAGIKSADLLPTEKICPKCGGDGDIMDDDSGLWVDCQTCDTTGQVSIYYTPEQYKEIMGKDYPDDGPVWEFDEWTEYRLSLNKDAGKRRLLYNCGHILIVQTAQPAPAADYRTEE